MPRKPKYHNEPHIKPMPPSAANYANGCRCNNCRAEHREYQNSLNRRTRLIRRTSA